MRAAMPGVVRRDDLRAVLPVDLVAVVLGRVVARGDHDAGRGAEVLHREGGERRRAGARREYERDAGGGEDAGGVLGELAAHAAPVAADHHAARRRVGHVCGEEVLREARRSCAGRRRGSSGSAGAEDAAQPGGAELERAGEAIARDRRGRLLRSPRASRARRAGASSSARVAGSGSCASQRAARSRRVGVSRRPSYHQGAPEVQPDVGRRALALLLLRDRLGDRRVVAAAPEGVAREQAAQEGEVRRGRALRGPTSSIVRVGERPVEPSNRGRARRRRGRRSWRASGRRTGVTSRPSATPVSIRRSRGPPPARPPAPSVPG